MPYMFMVVAVMFAIPITFARFLHEQLISACRVTHFNGK